MTWNSAGCRRRERGDHDVRAGPAELRSTFSIRCVITRSQAGVPAFNVRSPTLRSARSQLLEPEHDVGTAHPLQHAVERPADERRTLVRVRRNEHRPALDLPARDPAGDDRALVDLDVGGLGPTAFIPGHRLHAIESPTSDQLPGRSLRIRLDGLAGPERLLGGLQLVAAGRRARQRIGAGAEVRRRLRRADRRDHQRQDHQEDPGGCDPAQRDPGLPEEAALPDRPLDQVVRRRRERERDRESHGVLRAAAEAEAPVHEPDVDRPMPEVEAVGDRADPAQRRGSKAATGSARDPVAPRRRSPRRPRPRRASEPMP